MSQHLRIIDANANRAREALRVMEDAARFVLDDEGLCVRLKRLRHGLGEALQRFDGAGPAMAWRDTAGDVGTGVTAPGEFRRESVRDVVIAAGKRLSEALRSIEEFAKLPDATGDGGALTFVCGDEGCEAGSGDSSVARRIEALRYAGYDIERDLVLAMGSGRPIGWRLCVVLSESLCVHHGWLEVASRSIEGGADCLQLREKRLDSRELLERAYTLVGMAREAGVSVVVNDRPDIAVLSGADGVHLGQTDMPVREARKIVGGDMLVGVSTENIEQARAALRDGADYCGVGPMFPTTTKDKPRIAGPQYLREYAAHEPELPPCLAIGGVTPERMAELRAAAGAGIGERWGVAVSSAVCGAREPAGACRALLAKRTG